MLSTRVIILLVLSITSSHVFSQALVATIEIDGVQSAYVDRPGDLYILQKNNTLKKFDIQGTLISKQSFQETPTVFDPRDGARLFTCFKTNCAFYTEETRQEFTIAHEFVIEPSMICSSGDHNVWVLDKADFTLKKISPSQSKMLTEVFLAEDLFGKSPEILMMREYQNFLFILEKKIGIVIFNGLGKRIRIINEPDLTYFNFLGEEIYYKKNSKLVFYDLFDGSTREEVVDPTCKFALLTDTRTYLVYENKINIFQKN